MPNTSATAGFLTPSATPTSLEGEALVNFLQEWIVGITGLAATLVRPLWQPEPPNIPREDVTWAAFGIKKRLADTFAYEEHFPAGQGYNIVQRHEILEMLSSFYGPSADDYATRLREGMQLAQNREILSLNQMGLVESGDLQTVPEMVKEKWLYRVDLPFSIRRKVFRKYQVLNLASAQGTLNNEIYTESIDATQGV